MHVDEVCPIVFGDSFSVDHELVKIVDILLDDASHVLEHGQFVPVVISKHAFCTDDGVADFAEVFDFFVFVL